MLALVEVNNEAKLCELFKSVHDSILQSGERIAVIANEGQAADQKYICKDGMVAITHEDGTLEIGVRSKGKILCGYFPTMTADGAIQAVQESRIENYTRNLETFQARLKL